MRAIVKFNRESNVTENHDYVPNHIVDILDELFNRFEWDFKEIEFLGLYNGLTRVFEILRVTDESCNDLSPFLDEAYDNLDSRMKCHIKF